VTGAAWPPMTEAEIRELRAQHAVERWMCGEDVAVDLVPDIDCTAVDLLRKRGLLTPALEGSRLLTDAGRRVLAGVAS